MILERMIYLEYRCKVARYMREVDRTRFPLETYHSQRRNEYNF